MGSDHAFPLSMGLVIVLMFMLQGSETLIVMSMLSSTRTRDVGRHDGDGSVDGADGDVADDPRSHGGGGGGGKSWWWCCWWWW